ncbi:MAG: hypothetical protein J6C92_05900, partial [Bacteroidaceae bacterium]|nr:hypothetical protein [Bacteroidaceae bacterium]
VQQDGITLSLIEGRTYNIIFWAQDADNKAYRLTDDGKISVNYEDYQNGGFSKMEQLDAFYATATVTVGAQKVEDKGTIYLTRPLAQVNFADNTTKPIQGTHKAVVTFYGYPTSFDPFSGTVTMSESDMSFIFKDFPEEETLNINSSPYYYVASNYLFAPAEGTTSIEATLDLQQIDGTSINTFEFRGEKAITLEKNKKTNVLGAIVLQPETWSVWDGEMPTESTLTIDPENQNRYIIDEANDVAWLSVKENAQSLAANSTFVMTVDVDMNNGSGLAAIQLPSGSTLDGDGHTIKGLQLENALLGDVTDITVKNLNIEETTIENKSADVTHIGVLVNTLKGSNTFSNIHIKSSSVSTQNGAAGGIVGYISRKDPNNREETLTVIFDDCHVTETTVNGTHSEGHFVGLLRGYDNKETLQFNSNCTLTLSATAAQADDFVSPYREGNEGAWLTDNDYSKYNGWLGDEECYRGTVMYGANRFIPCWDGTTKDIVPLKDGTTNLIYSAFDLAYFQGKAAGNIKLMENVCMEYDLDGASKNGTRNHIFTALSTLTTLEGNGKTIYNISIRDNYYGGFVKSDNCATTFKDVTFDGADIRVTHDTEKGDAYVGTLRGFAYAKTTVNNVHVKNGYLYGVNKMGGLCGGIFAEIDFDNSSVENYFIENYDSKIKDGGFYAYGECGGLIGMINSAKAKISNCSVNQTTMHVMGQNDIWLFITIPGRHVNDFIGDIRLDGGQRVDLINNTVSNNYFTSRKKDTHSNKCPIVGKCYKISGTAGTVYIGSTKVF